LFAQEKKNLFSFLLSRENPFPVRNPSIKGNSSQTIKKEEEKEVLNAINVSGSVSTRGQEQSVT